MVSHSLRIALAAMGALSMNAEAAPTITAPASAALAYPVTARGGVSETIFGETVADPYRWLENDVRGDASVQAWVAAENKVTQAYLSGLPGRDAIKARLTELWNYERYGIPVKRGARYFYTRNDGLQNQAALYVRDGLDGAPRKLVDPNGWSKDGATSLAEWEASKDGRFLVYGIQDGGTDWRTLKVLDVASGSIAPDEIKWVKYTRLAWARNDAGFFYSRFPEPEAGRTYQAVGSNHAVWFHKLGTPQSADVRVYATPDRPKLLHSAEVTDDGRWLVIRSMEASDNAEVTLIDLTGAKMAPRKLVRGLDNKWALVGEARDLFYFVTDLDAPRQRIVAIDAASAARKMREIVPQAAATLDRASLIGERLVASYMIDAKSDARLFDLDGKPAGSVKLPGIGSVDGFDGKAGDPETFFSFTSFNAPTTIYRYDTATGRRDDFAVPKVTFDPKDYVVEERFYPSKDGTRIPLFVVHKEGLDLSRGAPTLLYGYGGFDISLTPAFSIADLAWMEMGGVFAQASLRGGGEYGAAWHDAGRLANKQNVFDDFIAAAEYLIAQGITTRDQLAIHGRSNGGLLIGAVVNQRPDLFAAALPQVGVMDMLRFNRFTAGRYWVDDYGDPAKEEDFRVLRAYSPYHNIRGGSPYPAMLVTTGDTDDRVVPGHSFKYAAALQAADIGAKPHLIRIETRAGHGSGKPTDKIIDEFADMWAFAAQWTGLAVPPR